MLPKHYRLAKGSDFAEALRKGQRARGEFVDLKIKKTANAYVRIGFLVTRKAAKNAVSRNKIKRQLRAAMRDYVSDLEKGIDLVVIAKEAVYGRRFSTIKAEIQKLLRKKGLLV